MTDLITLEALESAMPPHLKTAANQSLVDQLNNLPHDPDLADNIRNNFISYTNVMKDGKFKTEDYLNAVVFVSYKLMGKSSKDAYSLTFPQRYAQLLARNTSAKDIAGYVSAYNRGKLVNLIMERCLVPSWVLNQDIYQKAINVQAELMMNSPSDKVRTDAANSLLTHLKKPETIKADINIGITESSGMQEMKQALQDLASMQKHIIESGSSVVDITSSKLIETKNENNEILDNYEDYEDVDYEPCNLESEPTPEPKRKQQLFK